MLIVNFCLCLVLASNTSCRTWHYYDSATGKCKCGNFLSCSSDGNQVEISIHDCATTSGQQDGYYIGACPFRSTVNSSNRMHSEMPSNASQLDEVVCGPYNRRGFLCGECKNGYGPAVYSFDLKCVSCSSSWSKYAIFVYLFLQFVPTTLIFICFVLFRFNITSGPLLGYVLFCQITNAFITSGYSFIYYYTKLHVSPSLRVLFDFSVTLSQLWSSQFFTTIIPPFCISEKLSGIHVNMLKLIPAIYPLVLVIFSCILMELHAKNYRMIGILWKPFKFIFTKANITEVTSDALFHALASFIVVSNNISVLITTYQFVNFSSVLNSTGHYHNKVIYTDPSLEWKACIPYIAIAAFFCIIITVIPSLILCIYPTRIYQLYLSRFLSAKKRLAITAFAEALHSCFKDGLNGTRDYRVLAGSPPFFALLCGAIVYFSQRINFWKGTFSYVETVLLMTLGCVVSYVKPCKSAVANISLSFHMILFGIVTILTYLWKSDLSVETYTLELTFIVTFLSTHILVAVWAGYILTKHALLRFGYQFHGQRCKVALSDMAHCIRVCICRRYSNYQEMHG